MFELRNLKSSSRFLGFKAPEPEAIQQKEISRIIMNIFGIQKLMKQFDKSAENDFDEIIWRRLDENVK